MDKLLPIFKDSLISPPDILIEMIWWALGVLFLLRVLKAIILTVQSKVLVGASSNTYKLIKSVFFSMLRGVFEPLETPIQRPKTRIAMALSGMIINYLSFWLMVAIVLAFLFFSIVIPSPESTEGFSPYSLIPPALIFIYFAVFFRAEADRDYIRLKERMHEYKKSKNNKK